MMSLARSDTFPVLDIQSVPLTLSDVPRIYALYRTALDAVPNPAAVRADEPSFFEEVFAVGGEIMGLQVDGDLVSYGVLRPELESEHDRSGLDDHVPASAGLRVLDGSAVHPQHWKHGLQRVIIEARVERAGALGAQHVIAKASPGNVPSMRNLLRCGFRIVTRVRKPYGWRYVHHRPVAHPFPRPDGGEWRPASDVVGATALFANDHAAVACRAEAGTPLLCFAKIPAS
ncbi:MAG: GNAT family N-acetyltransferase [Devosia sp.]